MKQTTKIDNTTWSTIVVQQTTQISLNVKTTGAQFNRNSIWSKFHHKLNSIKSKVKLK